MVFHWRLSDSNSPQVSRTYYYYYLCTFKLFQVFQVNKNDFWTDRFTLDSNKYYHYRSKWTGGVMAMNLWIYTPRVSEMKPHNRMWFFGIPRVSFSKINRLSICCSMYALMYVYTQLLLFKQNATKGQF